MNAPHAPQDTRLALQPMASTRCSRSVYFDRFARPELEKEERRQFFNDGFASQNLPNKVESWNAWLQNSSLRLRPEDLLFAQLQSRLMVNMAGGVMENAGLCLDHFGMPYIPGSAVKGCSRRMAIQRLLETETPEAEDQKAKKADLLVQIALAFGWSEQDWKTKRDFKPRPKSGETDEQFEFRWQKDWEKKRSDFAYACGDVRWSDVFIEAVQRALWKQVLRTEPPAEPGAFARAWKPRLSHFAGKVQFLPAYPLNVKLTDSFHPTPDELGELELDVVTVHHKKYYAGPERPNDPASARSWERDWGNAPDIEEPVPVVFPAVAPGHVFVFVVQAQESTMDSLAALARRWLADSLSTFGLGAKTAAGYGWFDCSDTLQKAVRREWDRLVHEFKKAQAEAQAKREAAETAAKAKQAEEERLDKAPPSERYRAEYAKLGDEPFAALAKKFSELNDDQRHGFVLALKDRRETAKRWAKKKPELLKAWQDYAQKLQPPIQLP
ncbi:MAG: hypothetical protein HYY24_04195 [Verrucomicrobia bacterium]|nr:hypothetical protein [Verrucomicrobiota bacterium]